MQAELDALERKVVELIDLTRRLRDENQQLRNSLAEKDGEAKRLNEKIHTARSRLEHILARLPEDEL
jgi:uncharacterized protein (TIGR02449 family)